MRTIAFLALFLAAAPAGAQEDLVARWREDVAHFRRQLPLLHANAFHDLTAAEFEKLTVDLERDIPNLREHEIIVRLAAIVAQLGPGDGHSWIPLLAPGRFHRLPVNLYVYSDGVFVRAVGKEYAGIAGARVIAIGDTAVAEAMTRLAGITSADNAMTKKSRATDLLSVPEVLRALKIAGGDPAGAVDFLVELPGGERRRVSIAAMPSLEGIEWVDARRLVPEPPLYLRHASRDPFDRHGATKHFWYEYLADRKLLYVNYSAVADSHDETVAAFFDRVFAFAGKTEVDKLVIDVRNNGGGNNYLNRPVFYGIIERRESLARPGHFFVIIGRETYSAAQNFVNLLDNHTAAIFVGEPTGASPNHYGDAIRFELPNSRLPIMVSTLWWQDLDPRDKRLWIAPHVAAEPSSTADRDGRDPALQAILDYKPEPSLTDRLRAALPNGHAAAAAALDGWRNDPRNKFQSGEAALNRLGAALYGEKRPGDALAIFELNAKANPDSWLAHNSLARAYAAVERKADAIREYRRALEIDPRAPMTILALDRLQKP